MNAFPLLRQALESDWGAVESLLTELHLPLEDARGHRKGFVVADSEGALLGCAAIERYGNVGLIRSVGVSERAQGRGVGAALVADRIASARTSGLDALYLLTTTAEPYFTRIGFRVVERSAVLAALLSSVEFRSACPASAVVMCVDLAPVRVVEPTVHVREATPADAPAIAEIYNQGMDDRGATFETRARSGDELASWFRDPRFPILVAEQQRRVVGWIAASEYRARECYAGVAEFAVYVQRDVRGHGIGDQLMGEFLTQCARAGFWKVLSRIFPGNAASRALCRRHGFRDVGVYRGHGRLDGEWRDVVIVERLIGEGTGL